MLVCSHVHFGLSILTLALMIWLRVMVGWHGCLPWTIESTSLCLHKVILCWDLVSNCLCDFVRVLIDFGIDLIWQDRGWHGRYFKEFVQYFCLLKAWVISLLFLQSGLGDQVGSSSGDRGDWVPLIEWSETYISWSVKFACLWIPSLILLERCLLQMLGSLIEILDLWHVKLGEHILLVLSWTVKEHVHRIVELLILYTLGPQDRVIVTLVKGLKSLLGLDLTKVMCAFNDNLRRSTYLTFHFGVMLNRDLVQRIILRLRAIHRGIVWRLETNRIIKPGCLGHLIWPIDTETWLGRFFRDIFNRYLLWHILIWMSIFIEANLLSVTFVRINFIKSRLNGIVVF